VTLWPQTFLVIHSFHPWRDKRFELVAYNISACGEDCLDSKYGLMKEGKLLETPKANSGWVHDSENPG
jgi:hypothetical protein